MKNIGVSRRSTEHTSSFNKEIEISGINMRKSDGEIYLYYQIFVD